MIATERIYRTAAGEIVAEDHPRAAFLLVPAGKEVPKEYEAKVKAFLGHDEPAEKKAELAENKAVKSAPNKAAAAAKKK